MVLIVAIIVAAFFLIVSGLAIFLTGRQKRVEIKNAGEKGEELVAGFLRKIAEKYNGILFNDYCFEHKGGYSTEIDHILVTKGGFFVIETKSNVGTVVGNQFDEEWDLIKKHYQEDKTFKNPVKQNFKHIHFLGRAFRNVHPKMTNIVIFPYADISQVKADNVFNLADAINYICVQSAEEIFSEDYLISIYNELKSLKEKQGITKKQHLQNIARIRKENK